MADVIQLSEARANRARRAFVNRLAREGFIAQPTADRIMADWLSAEHTAVMGPHKPTLPCERVPADLIELPSDCE